MRESLVDGRVMLRMALAALLSGAAGGLLLVTLSMVTVLAPRFAGGGPRLEGVAMMLVAGGAGGAVVASLPAFLAGAALWALQGRYRGARRPGSWAGAGAVMGACFWGLLQALIASYDGRFELDSISALTAAIFIASGAVAALVFRAAMRMGPR